MNGNARREKIIDIIKTSSEPVSGSELAKRLNVSRQVIVQDIALIRAANENIIATNRGYIVSHKGVYKRVFKVRHKSDELFCELAAIVDLGGKVKDVFVYHKVYGVIKAQMMINSRRDIQEYMKTLEGGVSTPLMNLTADYHYHTVEAESEEILDIIQEKLWELGFLAKLTEFEPVDFGR